VGESLEHAGEPEGRMLRAPGAVNTSGEVESLERDGAGPGVGPWMSVGLAGLASGLAAGVAARSAQASAPPMYGADIDPGAVIDKLLQRISYHPTPQDRQLAASMGYQAYLEYQLNYREIVDDLCDARLMAFPTLGYSAAEMYTLQPMGSNNKPQRPTILTCLSEQTESTITRAVFSQRQLYERMVEFWNDHFNVDIIDQDQVYLKPLHDREAIRAYALDRFENLLIASSMSPSMLHYLDNIASTKTAPNENFARELLELHTVTPDAGYTQQDVREVARCFTGWTHYSEDPIHGTSVGTFKFDMSMHDTGAKSVMQMEIPEGGGLYDGLAVLQMLAAHPGTANNIASKLCRFFLGEGTHPSIVAEAASVFLSSGGDIPSVLRVILKPAYVYDAPPRFKRPFHFYVSSMRSTAATVTSFADSRPHLDLMGHPLFAWTPPDGYPDTLTYWGRLLQPRWFFAIYLASEANNNKGSFTGVTIDDEALFLGCDTSDQWLARVNDRLFLGTLPLADQGVLATMLRPYSRAMRRNTLGVALCSPAFQWY